MDPNIWSKLPFDILEHIARLADIDARRAMGFLPKKLPQSDLNIPGIVTKEEHYTKIDFENATLCVNNHGDRQFFKGRVIMTPVFGSLLLEDKNGMMCIINPDNIPFNFEYIATF